METTVNIERLNENDTEEFLPSHEILRENLKAVRRRKIPKLFTEYKCKICKKVFTDKYGLQVHETIHDPNYPFQCEQCSYKAKNRKYLSRHVLKVHNKQQKRLECEICGMRFFYKCLLDKHFRVHSGEKPNKCDVCGKAFNSRYSLNTHRLIHSNEKPFKCSFCDYACRDSSSLKKHHSSHLGISKRYPCDQCSYKYNTKARLVAHIKEKHVGIEPESLSCDICGALFKKKWTLASHIRAVHEKTKSCKCGICGKIISNSANLKAHLRVHIDARPFKCTYPGCTKKYKENSALTKHTLIHYPVKQFVCNECGRRFTRRNRLMMHLKRREASKDGLCPNYYHKRSVKYYGPVKERDPNKVKLICDICGYKTTSKTKLGKHIRYGHGNDEDRECKICNKMFRKNEYLKLHYWNSHNVIYKSKTKSKPMVIIKQEPEDYVPDLEMDLFDIEKEEPFAGFDTEINLDCAQDQNLVDTSEQSRIDEQVNETTSPEVQKTENHEDDMDAHTTLATEDNIEPSEVEETRPTMKMSEFIQNIILAEQSDEDIEKEDTEKYVQMCIAKLMKKSNEKNGIGVKKTNFGRKLKKIDNVEANSILLKTNTRETNIDESLQTPERDEDKRSREKTRRNPTRVSSKRSNRRVSKGKLVKRLKGTRKRDEDISEGDGNSEVRADKDNDIVEMQNNTSSKMKFNTHQCYVCYKLFKTKPDLIEHCKEHFDVCNEVTLKKCPLCQFVTHSDIKRHVRLIHKIDINFSFMRIKDKKHNMNGSRYYFDVNDDNIKKLEIVPSIKILNKKASMDIDKRNRELKDKCVLKRKLVKKGKEWIVAHEKVDVSNRVVPNVADKDNYLESLKKINLESKKKGVQILFPCNHCEKVCQNLSALTLHLRKHDPNKKPFKPKIWKHKSKGQPLTEAVKDVVNTDNRSAKPKPIVTKHRCDPKLKDFYEKNIKGGDIEFWQFLKIYNKMSRENVNDFQDLEARTEFGIHISDKNENINESQEPDNNDVEPNDNVESEKLRK